VTEEHVFSQGHYSSIVASLDGAMAVMRGMGKSEAEAREWLTDFLQNHYFKVWRGTRA
jgi:hypothetical protein